MKALRAVLFPILFVLLVTVCNGYAEETQARRLTLMIYMCGSNLESGFGAATADIEEMKASGLRGSDVTVLLMTGGARQWSQGYDASQCLIHELGPRGTRVVWRSDSMNMGEAETLTQFLRFGREKYPADDYALILWDHGGGPNEGVCWDELFSLDRLSLQELSSAIENAFLGQKLEWIGFDACLMGSLEVACAMAPYANYMIASQETEPSLGWNYSFLRELPMSIDGDQSGRLIAEKYLENRVLSGEALTMACLDLSKAKETAEQTGRYFGRYRELLDSEHFVRLSSIRSMTTGFGRGVEGSGNDGYDLVDLKDLVDRMDQADGSASELSAQIQDMVVCCRSNKPGVNGISIYYPFENKSKYESIWRERYRGVAFHPGYSAYMDAFGKLLMGEPLIDWAGLSAVYEGTDSDGNHHFSLPLTSEQREGLVSAELLILQETPSSEAGKTFVTLIGSEKVSLDQSDSLSVVYRNRTLRAVAQKGSQVSPISLHPAREGDTYTAAAILMPPEGGMDAAKNRIVFFDLGKEQETGRVEISQIRIADEDTGSITNRYAYSEEGFGSILFWTIQKRIPSIEDEGWLPGFYDWPNDHDSVTMKGLKLPNDWHFEYAYEPMVGKNLFAVFQLTDTQHNTYCTVPIRIPDPSRSDSVVSPDVYDSKDYRISAAAYTDGSPGNEQLKVEFSIENKSEQTMRFSLRNLVLNDHRQTHKGQSIDIQAGQSGTCTVAIPVRELSWLDQISEVSARLIIQTGDDYSDPVALRFHLPALSLEHLANEPTVLYESRANNVIYRLMSINPKAHDIDAVVYIENHSAADIMLENSCLLNGIAEVYLGGAYDAVAPEDSCFCDLYINRDLYILSYQFSCEYTADVASMVYFAGGFEIMGIQSLQLITLQESLSGQEIQFEINPAIQLQTDTNPSNASTISAYEMVDRERLDNHIPVLLFQSDQVTVQADWILTGERGVVVCCTLKNNSDTYQKLALSGFMLNDTMVEANHYDDELSYELRPNSIRQQRIVLGDTDDSLFNVSLQRIAFKIKSGKEAAEHPCEIRIEPVKLGKKSVLLDGNQTFSVIDPHEPDVPPESDEPAADEAEYSDMYYRSRIPLPENPDQYRVWLEAPLTEEQCEQFAKGKAVIIRQTDHDTIELLSLLTLQKNDKGHIGAWCSGLLSCLEDDPDLILLTTNETETENGKQFILMPVLLVFNTRGESFTLDEIHFEISQDSDHAVVTEIITDGEAFDREELQGVKLLTYEFFYPYELQESAPYYAELEGYSDFMWYLNCPELLLDKTQIKMALRPITKEDHLYVLFSIKDEDDKSYSLPLIVYPVSR